MEPFEIWSNKDQKNQKSHLFEHFRLSEGYVYRRIFIVNPLLQSFWGATQLYTIGGSRDMKNHAIS